MFRPKNFSREERPRAVKLVIITLKDKAEM